MDFWHFAVLFIGISTTGALALHCHKCNTEQVQCGDTLGSDKFLQQCPDEFHYCTMIWTKENVVKRGCTNGTLCDEFKADEETYCCDCQQNGCNWGRESCNGQTILESGCFLIIPISVSFLMF